MFAEASAPAYSVLVPFRLIESTVPSFPSVVFPATVSVVSNVTDFSAVNPDWNVAAPVTVIAFFTSKSPPTDQLFETPPSFAFTTV